MSWYFSVINHFVNLVDIILPCCYTFKVNLVDKIHFLIGGIILLWGKQNLKNLFSQL